MASPAIIEVVGSLNMDLVTVTPRVPGSGETIAATSFSTGFGGKGANQAVACARLSNVNVTNASDPPAIVAMHGAVGNDQFGTEMRRHLEGEGIDVSGVSTKPEQTTGTAVILVEEGTGENRILYSAGANGLLLPSDVEYLAAAASARLVVFQLETPLDTVVGCMEKAKMNGSEVLLNPAPAIVLPEAVYASIDHLILNESEASILSGVAETDLTQSLEKVAALFCSKGVRNVIITLGAQGVFLQTSTGAQNAKPGHLISGRKVQVVDTTAAGDTFVGAYSSYLVRHGSGEVLAAVEFANLAASMAVQKAGAQTSIPHLEQVHF